MNIEDIELLQRNCKNEQAFEEVLSLFESLTDRLKKAEEALHQYEYIVNNAPDSIVVVDRDYRYQFANENFDCIALKFSPSPVGQLVADVIGKETFYGEVLPYLQRCLAGETVTYQSWRPVPGRSDRLMKITLFPYRDPAGKIVGAVGFCWDATDFKMAEEQLAYHARLLDIMDDAVISTDEKFRIVSWNKGAEKMYGWREAEVIGKIVTDVISVSYLDGTLRQAGDKLIQGGTLRGDFTQTRRDGTTFVISAAVSLIYDDAGAITGLVAVCHDITDRREAEALVRQQQRLIERINDTMPAMISIFDLDEPRLTFTNHFMEHLFASAADDNEDPYLRAIHPDDRQRIIEHTFSALPTLADGEVSEVEFRILGADGTWHDLEVRSVALERGADGRVRQALNIGFDVSARRRTEAALRENEQFLRAIYGGVEAPIFVVDVLEDGDFRYAGINAYGERVLRLTSADFVGKSPEQFAAVMGAGTGYGAWMRGNYERCVQTGTSTIYEESAVMHGRPYHVITQLSPLFDADGRVVRLVGFSVDITPQREAEAALRESERFLRAIFDGVQSSIFVVDVTEDGDFRFLTMNRADEYHLGITAEEIRGKRPEDLIELVGATEARIAELRDRYTECVRLKKPIIYEPTTIVSGVEKHWITQLSPLIDENERVYRLVSFSLDVTARREAAERIRRSEERIHRIVAQTHAAIFALDAYGIFTFSDGLALDAIGLPGNDITGLSAFDVYRDNPDMMRALDEVYAGRTSRAELQFGGHTYDAIFAPVHDETGRLVEVTGVAIDISERKQAEADRQRLAGVEMELVHEREMRAFQSRVLSMITHDFKTPLASIALSAEMLRRSNGSPSPAEADDRIDRIQAQVRVLDHMVDDIVALRRGESHTYTPLVERLALGEFLSEIIEDVRITNRRRVSIRLDMAAACDRVFVDATLLRQIALNLISNAVKYSFADGEVCVRCECAADSLTLSVRDEGIGIPAVDQPHIFEIFYRADNASSIAGNGIGLAIVRQAVETHGGTITFESSENRGSCFRVTLPFLTP